MLGERALEYAKRAGLNEYYTPQVEVDIGGVSFLVYGSMSWTVATVRTMDWEGVHKAYVSITGDTRDEPDKDAARNVVAGELQKHWADCQNRQDLMPSIEEQQKKRIKFALKDPPATPAGSHAAHGRTKRGGRMSKKGKKKDGDGEQKIPQRGASGMAAKLISEGNHNREDVTKKVTEAFPDVKNVAPAVSYAARCVGVDLE